MTSETDKPIRANMALASSLICFSILARTTSVLAIGLSSDRVSLYCGPFVQSSHSRAFTMQGDVQAFRHRVLGLRTTSHA